MTAGFAWLLIASSPSPANAGPPTGDVSAAQTPAELAETRHRAGVAAFALGHYRDAIDLFLEANRLRPSAAISFNVARGYEQLGDASNALAWYRDYVRRSDGAGDSTQVAPLITRLEERLAQRGVQQVTVTSSPPGATVLIDGTAVGVSPWTGDLAPGKHAVELRLRGFDDQSKDFDLPRDQALDVELALAPRRALPDSEPPVAASEPPAIEPPRVPASTTMMDAPPKAGERSGLTTAGWIALGTSGAALGSALVFELLRSGAETDAQHESRQIQFAHDVERMHSLQTAAGALGALGVTLAVAGGTLLIFGATENERAPSARVALSCAPYRCRASLTGRF